MPGVFKPFWSGQDILVDGGIMNPLPTEPLFKMWVKKIIAVNVTPSREDMLAQYGKMRQDIAGTCKPGPVRWFNWKRCFQAKLKNNILDVIFSSVEAMQSEMIIREAELADIVLHPDTSGMHWLEMHRARDFAKRGEEEARKNLARIWQAIKE
jgi:NTE family protein